VKCDNCHSELEPSDQFCGKCGWSLSAAIEPRSVMDTMTGVAAKVIDEELAQAARALVRRGRRIEAVKLVKESIGCGLKEAEDYVESL
jgi:ribosomal protein L7/L12